MVLELGLLVAEGVGPRDEVHEGRERGGGEVGGARVRDELFGRGHRVCVVGRWLVDWCGLGMHLNFS